MLELLAFVFVAALQNPEQAHAQAAQTETVAVVRDTALRTRRVDRDHEMPDALRARKTRTPLTPALLANAYRDASARDIVSRARTARLEQDSSLVAYDARAVQRMSAGLGLRAMGRQRLVFRNESATRVRWQRGTGAWIDVEGTRTAIPLAFPGARALAGTLEMSPVPYFPGREGLLRFTGMERVTDQEGLFIHPLTEGAEAYYRYKSGDTISYSLPGGRTIRIAEVTVRAREPAFDLILGSLWFDLKSAQVVRAAYRPAAPFDIKKFVEEEEGEEEFDDVPRAIRPLIFPMVATIEAFTVEYGLHQGRWWLPRLQSVNGRVQVGVMRSPFEVFETFTYASVNGTDPLPPIVVDTMARQDRTTVQINVGREKKADFDNGFGDCAPGDTLTRTEWRYNKSVAVAIRIPCDTAALAASPALPPSIFDPSDELFGARERKELEQELTIGLEPEWSPQSIDWSFLERGMLRYNRVEGLSAGTAISQELGSGLSWRAAARLGHADLEPNVDLRLTRGDAVRGIALGVYRRLAVVDDWGAPLGLGNSANALLFGRDEGFYYRTAGVEALGVLGPFEWRLFGERQRTAHVETQLSLPHAINGLRFRENVVAAHADLAGAGIRLPFALGLDPRAVRLNGALRLEAATGDLEFGRAAMDATVIRNLAAGLAGALTVSGGTTTGDVPAQRLWYLGGTHTVRGHPIGTNAGDAYWFGRAELSTDRVAFRPVVFFDGGWAGSREDWSHPGKPMLGAGLGWSVLEGFVRFDLAKGIRPNRGVRASLYLDASF
ncbi:MAG: hypothetical protein ACT4PJ_00005 [Gemmatimonadaceae bacterium]